MATKVCYKWGCPTQPFSVLWKDANWLWSECQLVQEIISQHVGIDPTNENFFPKWIDDPTTALDKEKRKRFIRLLCKVKGEDYDESKVVRDDIKISVADIKIVVKKVAGVDLIITEE